MQQILLLLGCFFTNLLWAQSLSIEYGLMHVYTLVQGKTPFLNPSTADNLYGSFEYDHAFSFFNAGIGYLSYRPKTAVNMDAHPQSNLVSIAQGSMLAHSPYLEISKPIRLNKRIRIQPQFRLHFAYVKKSMVSDLPRYDFDPWMWVSFENHPYTGFQLQPQVRFSFKVRCWKSLHFGLNMGYMQGFRKVHQLDVEYGVKKGIGQGIYQNLVYSQGSHWNLGMALQYGFQMQTRPKEIKNKN